MQTPLAVTTELDFHLLRDRTAVCLTFEGSDEMRFVSRGQDPVTKEYILASVDGEDVDSLSGDGWFWRFSDRFLRTGEPAHVIKRQGGAAETVRVHTIRTPQLISERR